MLTAFLDALPIALDTVQATLPLVGVPLILATRPNRTAHLAFLAGFPSFGPVTSRSGP